MPKPIGSQNENRTKYWFAPNEFPDGFQMMEAPEFAASLPYYEGVFGTASIRHLLNPEAKYVDQVWIDWQLFFYNLPSETPRGYAIGMAVQRDGTSLNAPDKYSVRFARFGCVHRWRRLTADELKERKLHNYMFDNHSICTKCGTYRNFDSSD